MVKELLLVGTGGFAGSIARYSTSLLMAGTGNSHPLLSGTFMVNALGSLLIGLFLVITKQSGWFYLCVVGFCGGFTTFSSFSAEVFVMVRTSQYGPMALYIAVSILICVLFVWAGTELGQRILK